MSHNSSRADRRRGCIEIAADVAEGVVVGSATAVVAIAVFVGIGALFIASAAPVGVVMGGSTLRWTARGKR